MNLQTTTGHHCDGNCLPGLFDRNGPCTESGGLLRLSYPQRLRRNIIHPCRLVGYRVSISKHQTCADTNKANSDIYRPTERATALGWFLSGTLIGPAFGPFLGGIIVTYTTW